MELDHGASGALQTFVVGWKRSLVFHVHQRFCCTYEAKTAKHPHKCRVCRILRWHLVVKQLRDFWCWIGEARAFSRPNMMEGGKCKYEPMDDWERRIRKVLYVTTLIYSMISSYSHFKRGRVFEMGASDSNSILWNTFCNTQFAQKYATTL